MNARAAKGRTALIASRSLSIGVSDYGMTEVLGAASSISIDCERIGNVVYERERERDASRVKHHLDIHLLLRSSRSRAYPSSAMTRDRPPAKRPRTSGDASRSSSASSVTLRSPSPAAPSATDSHEHSGRNRGDSRAIGKSRAERLAGFDDEADEPTSGELAPSPRTTQLDDDEDSDEEPCAICLAPIENKVRFSCLNLVALLLLTPLSPFRRSCIRVTTASSAGTVSERGPISRER